MIRKLIFIFMLCVVGLQAFSISIDQPSIFLETEAGSEKDFYITVTNKNSFPINVKIYAQDWQYNDFGAKSFLPETNYGLSQWLKLPQNQEFQLLAFAEKKIKFTLETPMDAQGGKVGVIFFQTQADIANKKGVSYSARIGSIIYQHTVDRSSYQMELVKALYYKSVTSNILDLVVLNKGDGYNFLQGTITLLDTTNKPLQSQQFKIQALPEDRQSLQLKLPFVDRLIITAEDLKGQLISQILTLQKDVSQAKSFDDSRIVIKKMKLLYSEPNLKIFLKVFGSINKSITSRLKILDSSGKTVETIALGKKFLEEGIVADFNNNWEGTTNLADGTYLLKVEFLDNNSRILSELHVGQLNMNKQLTTLDVFDVDGRELKL